jgi:hypothetical protein
MVCLAVELRVPPPVTEPFEVQTLAVTVHNDRPEPLAGQVVFDLLPPWGTHTRVTAPVAAAPGETVVVPLRYELFQAGEQPLTLTVESGGQTLASWSTTLDVPDREPPLPELRLTPPPADAVTVITPDHRVRKGGRPWFPLGLYDTPTSAARAAELAAAGFDLVAIHPAPPDAVREMLDLLSESKLNAWIPIGHLLSHTDDPSQRQELEALVAGVADHPSLALWESYDEPAWNGIAAWRLQAGYELLRALDPRRPLWTNHAPRNTVSTLAWYNRATDIAGADVYPVPMPQTQSDLPNKTLAVVGDETVKNLAAVAGQKPVFMVIQGFAWKHLSDRGAPDAVFPTLAESRFMAYDATVNGAAGLLWWGIRYAPRPSPFWSDLRTVVSELASLRDILALPPEPVDGLSEPLRGAVWAFEDGRLLAVVNRSGQPATARVALGDGWRTLFGDPAPRVAANEMILELPAWGVRVLTDHPTFAPQPRRFAPEPARPVAELPRVAGNAVANPSFEADADGDGLPDGWDVRFPLSAVLDPEVKHSGAASFRLTASRAGFRPLAVQQNLVVKPDASYVLSGWMRSDTPEVKARIYVEWVTAGVYHGQVLPWTEPPAEWTEYRIPFQARSCPGGRIYVVVQAEGPGRVWFDDLGVEEAP